MTVPLKSSRQLFRYAMIAAMTFLMCVAVVWMHTENERHPDSQSLMAVLKRFAPKKTRFDLRHEELGARLTYLTAIQDAAENKSHLFLVLPFVTVMIYAVMDSLKKAKRKEAERAISEAGSRAHVDHSDIDRGLLALPFLGILIVLTAICSVTDNWALWHAVETFPLRTLHHMLCAPPFLAFSLLALLIVTIERQKITIGQTLFALSPVCITLAIEIWSTYWGILSPWNLEVIKDPDALYQFTAFNFMFFAFFPAAIAVCACFKGHKLFCAALLGLELQFHLITAFVAMLQLANTYI